MKVLILGYHTCMNFGDRLGLDLVTRLLPPEALVTRKTLPPFWDEPGEDFDLVIVGTGHSIFHKSLDPEFLKFLSRQRLVYGIFGFQYHNLIPKESLRQLLGSMDHWFSRSNEDIIFANSIGCIESEHTHLGDWLINAFPMTSWYVNKTLVIPASFKSQLLDLQVTIQQIQAFRRVSSARLHPILCALTSAEKVKYNEQAEMGGMAISGKFRSMFIDIFNNFPSEGEWFDIDKAMVQEYKLRVYGNTEKMREIVWAGLGAGNPSAFNK